MEDLLAGVRVHLGSRIVVREFEPRPLVMEKDTVELVSEGLVEVAGLPEARFYDLLLFEGGTKGVVIDLREKRITALILKEKSPVEVGTSVYRTGEVASIRISEEILGRMIDPKEEPLEGRPLSVREGLCEGIVALIFLFPVVLGTYLGWWLDGRYRAGRISWTITFMLLGIMVGAYNVYRIVYRKEVKL